MNQKLKKVAVIGLGYVGLPTYVALKKTGKYDVVGYTRTTKRVNQINKGNSPIEDSDVSAFLKNNKAKVTNDQKNFKNTDYFIICVPTPVKTDYMPDYEPVISASEMIAPFITKNTHFILESTVNPGTCEEIIKPVLEKISGLTAGIDFNIAHCPERVNPGDKKWNIYNISRNIGSINNKWNKKAANFYRSFLPGAKINEVSCLKVAEATKIVENAFRDINIAYVNELAKSFDVLGIDLIETLNAAANKPFAFMKHSPGCGVGGHCIAVDPYYLIRRASLEGFDHQFLKIAREVNNSMPEYTVERLILALNEIGLPLKGTPVTLLGLSYKPDIADLRESPALKIKQRLEELGAVLTAYDPYIHKNITLKKAISKSKAVVLATAHKQFIDQLPKLLPKTKIKVLIDARNSLPTDKIKKINIIYKGIGR